MSNVPLLKKKFCKIHSPFEIQMCGEFNNDCAMALNVNDVVGATREFDKRLEKLEESIKGMTAWKRLVKSIRKEFMGVFGEV